MALHLKDAQSVGSFQTTGETKTTVFLCAFRSGAAGASVGNTGRRRQVPPVFPVFKALPSTKRKKDSEGRKT